jgi:hypothetical protein
LLSCRKEAQPGSRGLRSSCHWWSLQVIFLFTLPTQVNIVIMHYLKVKLRNQYLM